MDEVFDSPTGEADEIAKREIREWLMRSDRGDDDGEVSSDRTEADDHT